MIVMSLILCGLIIFAVSLRVLIRGDFAAGVLVSAVGLFISMGYGSVPGFLAALLLLLVCISLARRSRKPTFSRVAGIGGGVFAIAMVGGALLSMPHLIRMRELRKKYPITSMAPRLAYEARPVVGDSAGLGAATPTSASTSRFGPPPMGTPAWTIVNAVDDRPKRWFSRVRTLSTIHASFVEQFVSAPGFGIMRGMPMLENYSVVDSREPAKSLPGTEEHYPATIQQGSLRVAGDPLLPYRSKDDAEARLESRLLSVHSAGRRDFIDPEDTGLVVDRDHVAGFVPHRFSSEFEPDRDITLVLQRLQLVSLRRFGRPMVYVTNKDLPRMENIEKVPTRELNAFEVAALDSLAKGEELGYMQQGRSVLALGALRARDECTKCHEVERGALLGAFSYEFLGGAPPVKTAKPPI